MHACAGSMGTKLHWRHLFYFWMLRSHDRRDALRLNSMDQVISVLIPLATTKPAFLTNFSRFRHVMALDGVTLHDEHDGQSTKKLQPFKTSFHLYTTQLDDAVHDSLLEDDDARKQDVLSLSQALETGHFLHPMLLDTRYESLREFTKLVDGWVVDEMSVTVPCPEYVWRVIAVASLLAGGGLGIGFSVGDRINGVDPSNLATYLWVVAAFIILIAKNMKVKEWAWNDFLRRRVRCCSVSELQSMTGVDAQLIIYKLLHDERRGSVLNIRGPYNSAFLRRANEGFAIDVPISSSTLRRSGLVMLKVATAQGYALVCLDFRTGTELSTIGHAPDSQKEYLICEQIDDLVFEFRSRRRKSPSKHSFLRSRGMKWKRVLGVYLSEEAKFI